MADNHSFDIVSEIDFQEVTNAVNQAKKEVLQRYDLKDSNTEIDFDPKEKKLKLSSSEEFKLKATVEILIQKLIKRNISPKALDHGEMESALGGRAKQEITLTAGISTEKAKEINRDIKDSKLKVQTQIQGEQIRVSAKKIDDLQEVMKLLREKEYSLPLQFNNYR